MKEIVGDIWDYHKQGLWIVITTNGTVKTNGEAVMGRGVALQAKQKFRNIADWVGWSLRARGNHCAIYTIQLRVDDRLVASGVITFPVKHDWQGRADIQLIEQSCQELVKLVEQENPEKIYMVRPGCGNGGLDWKDVKPILEKYLDDRFVVVERRGGRE